MIDDGTTSTTATAAATAGDVIGSDVGVKLVVMFVLRRMVGGAY